MDFYQISKAIGFIIFDCERVIGFLILMFMEEMIETWNNHFATSSNFLVIVLYLVCRKIGEERMEG